MSGGGGGFLAAMGLVFAPVLAPALGLGAVATGAMAGTAGAAAGGGALLGSTAAAGSLVGGAAAAAGSTFGVTLPAALGSILPSSALTSVGAAGLAGGAGMLASGSAGAMAASGMGPLGSIAQGMGMGGGGFWSNLGAMFNPGTEAGMQNIGSMIGGAAKNWQERSMQERQWDREDELSQRAQDSYDVSMPNMARAGRGGPPGGVPNPNGQDPGLQGLGAPPQAQAGQNGIGAPDPSGQDPAKAMPVAAQATGQPMTSQIRPMRPGASRQQQPSGPSRRVAYDPTSQRIVFS